MANHLSAVSSVLLLSALSLAGCAKSNATSSAKAEASQSEAVWRMVPADGIELYIPPAKDLPGRGAAMNGIWYCHFGEGRVGLFDGAALLTLNGSTVSNNNNTFHFGTYAPQHYAFNPTIMPYDSIADKDPLDAALYVGYDVVFTSDTDLHLEIYTSTTLDDPGTRHTFGYSFSASLDPNDSDHFVRKSSLLFIPAPNYELYRIVDGNGDRTKHYEDVYKADIAASGTKTLAITALRSSPLATEAILANEAPRQGSSVPTLSSANVPGSNGTMTAASVAASAAAN